ncbi:MAG: hypothetical protein HY816_03515 [Candidatus Wallbacteria bacterium]|nr:hypothetical protein [Candidatus Wallbacteria bacterium]
MGSRQLRILGLGLMMASALVGQAFAERLLLVNGLEVKGYITGNENGHYLVQIGKYTKRVPESQVKSIVDDAATAPAPSGVAAPAPSAAAGGAIDIAKLLGGAGGGGQMGGGIDLSALLGGAGGGGGGLDVSKILGGGGGGAMDLSGLLGGGGGGNIMAMAEKMKDPAFQQQFLAQIEERNRSGGNPGAATPYINMLKGLFAQLNSAPKTAPAKPPGH